MRSGEWDQALALAARDGPAARDVIEWHRLRAGRGTAEEVLDFLSRNPDWPGLDWLRRRSEDALAEAGGTQVRGFFADATPVTGRGMLAYARAMEEAGETGSAQAGIVLAWRSYRLSADEQAEMLVRYPDLLAPHHAARLDMALWKHWTEDAARMFSLVTADQVLLAEARIGLRTGKGDPDALIAAVPEALRDTPGLAFERFEWRMRKGRRDDATQLLQERSTSVQALGEPAAWAARRIDLARDLIRRDPARAYAVAASHFLTEGADYAELEWLAGFVALRMLDRPDLAIGHFTRFAAAVTSPISVGRAGYWLGRAHEAAGDAAAAQAAYRLGAANQTAFYGLLAAERAGLPFDLALAPPEDLPDWRTAGFARTSVFQAAVLLLAADDLGLAERFFTHLAEGLDARGAAQMGRMLEELGQPHIQVMLGKRMVQFGIVLPGPYFAMHPVGTEPHLVPNELVLAIARRESEFDAGVVSGAGARGLMQVMPATAREMADALGEPFDADLLLSDWSYNARLGSAYLARLAAEFDGNLVMMAAGYNAGPSRPSRWMEAFGDPRAGQIDMIDWIEMIPFDETRNYVMRVAESVPVYRTRLGKPPHPVPFSAELVGATMRVIGAGD